MEIETVPEIEVTSTRWPIRPRPENGELLSSWVNRLALANGMAPGHLHETLAHVAGPTDRQWAHGTPSRGLAEYLSAHTGDDVDTILKMAAVPPASSVGRDDMHGVFAAAHPRVVLRQRAPVDPDAQVTAENAYMVYCPLCLADDEDPWFRRNWRSRLAVGCTRHQVRLLHACPGCGRQIHPHLSKVLQPQAYCAYCSADLRSAATAPLSAREKADIADTDDYLEAILGTLPLDEIASKGEDLLRRATRVVAGTGHFWHLYFGPSEIAGGLEWIRRPAIASRDDLAAARGKEVLSDWNGRNPTGLGGGRLIGYANRYAIERYYNKLLDQQIGALRLVGVIDSLIFVDDIGLGDEEDRTALKAALNTARPGDTLVTLGLEFLARTTVETMETIQLLRQRGIQLWLLDAQLHTGTDGGRPLFDMVEILDRAQRRRKMAWRLVGFMNKAAAGLCQNGALRSLSPDQMRQAGRLLKAGVRIQDIAERFGIANSTVRKWKTEMLSLADDDLDDVDTDR